MTEYFTTRERVVASLDEVDERIKQVAALAASTGLTFYWRGQADAGWGVHSSLHRALAANRGLAPSEIDQIVEAEVVDAEQTLINEARPWIRPSVGARLTTVDLLARLQHEGVPTRLIDFTSDPLVALYFAVADCPDRDGRIVVASARGVAGDALKDAFDVPWERGNPARPSDWGEQLYALEDQADFLRIIRQRGVFLIGGTPSTRPHRRYPDGTSLSAVEVRSSMSIPLALQAWVQAEAAFNRTTARGPAVTVASALTLRIPQDNKAAIRRSLEKSGRSWSTLFPDAAGLARRGPFVSTLTSS